MLTVGKLKAAMAGLHDDCMVEAVINATGEPYSAYELDVEQDNFDGVGVLILVLDK